MCTELSDTNVKQKKKRKLVWVMYNFAKKMEALSPPPPTRPSVLMTRILKIQIKYELSTKNEREAHKKTQW